MTGGGNTYAVLDVDCVSTRLEEAESTVKEVGVDDLGDKVVDKLHGNLLLGLVAEEFGI